VTEVDTKGRFIKDNLALRAYPVYRRIFMLQPQQSTA